MKKNFEVIYIAKGKIFRNLNIIFKEEGVSGLHFHIKNEIFAANRKNEFISAIPFINKKQTLYDFKDEEENSLYYFLIDKNKNTMTIFKNPLTNSEQSVNI